MREVEREDRQAVALGAGHDGGVGEAEVEVGEAGVDLDGAAQQAGERYATVCSPIATACRKSLAACALTRVRSS